MSWFVNDPPRWLAKALAIVNGNAPVNIGSEIVPVVDSLQKGWGDITWDYFTHTGAVGSVSQTAPAGFVNLNVNRIFTCSFDNPDTAASTFTLDLVTQNVYTPIVLHRASVPASSVQDAKTILQGQYMLIPAGFYLRCTTGPATTTAPTANFHIGTAPFGLPLIY